MVLLSFTEKMIFLKQLGVNFKMSTKLIHMASRCKTFCSNIVYIKMYKRYPLKYQYFIHRKYQSSFKEIDTDSDNEDITDIRNIRNIILPNNDDPLTTQISECKSLQEIFYLLQHNSNQLNWKNISMALAMVREFQLIYYRVFVFEKNLDCINNIPVNNFDNILTNEDFLNLLNLINNHHMFMNIQCLSYCILCLHKIGINKNSIVNLNLSHRLKTKLINTPIEEIQPCVLSRFTVSVVGRRDLSGLYILSDIWPLVLNKISM